MRVRLFALVNRSRHVTSSQVGLVTAEYRGQDIFRLGNTVRAMSAYDGRLAVLAADGSIRLRTESGVAIRSFVARGATTLALGAKTLVVITRDHRLAVYSVASGRLLHRWMLPRGAAHVDLQYGIAVVTAGHSVYAINTANGRHAKSRRDTSCRPRPDRANRHRLRLFNESPLDGARVI